MRKEFVQTRRITFVQFGRVGMQRTDHLRKIDQYDDGFGFSIVQEFDRFGRFFDDRFFSCSSSSCKLLQPFRFPRSSGTQHARCRFGRDGQSRVTHVRIVFLGNRRLLYPTQIDQQVEFVQIAMDQPVLGQPQRQRAGLMENRCSLFGRQFWGPDLIQGDATYQTHGDDVTIVSDRFRSWVLDVVQGFHKGEFLQGRLATQEQPGIGLLLLGGAVALEGVLAVVDKVISLLLDVTKRRPSESMKLEYDLLSIRMYRQVDVRFLSGTDPISNRRDAFARL
mmetsp:Transcript_121124/g.180910  ORF Transcript_121124/g.180910 Transcript_121124/m.180910 type:complete len:279 (-) Transcript_121124:310-1146(-)